EVCRYCTAVMVSTSGAWGLTSPAGAAESAALVSPAEQPASASIATAPAAMYKRGLRRDARIAWDFIACCIYFRSAANGCVLESRRQSGKVEIEYIMQSSVVETRTSAPFAG